MRRPAREMRSTKEESEAVQPPPWRSEAVQPSPRGGQARQTSSRQGQAPVHTVHTWNMCCTSRAGLALLLIALRPMQWLAVALQEVHMSGQDFEADTLHSGNRLLVGPGNEGRKPVGLLLARGVTLEGLMAYPGLLVASVRLPGTSAAQGRQLTICSVHAPATQCWLQLDTFLQQLVQALARARGPVILMGDFQVDLTDPCDSRAAPRDGRVKIWHAFLAERGLRVVGPGIGFTWRSFDGRKQGNKDFICISPSLLGPRELATVCWLHDAPTDHALVSCGIHEMYRPQQRTRVVPWQRVREEDRERHGHVLKCLNLDDVHAWEACVLASASSLRARRGHRTAMRAALVDAREAVRRARTPREWSITRRTLWRLQRRMRRQQAQERLQHTNIARRARPPVEYLEIEEPEGVVHRTADVQIWQAFLTDHANHTYGDGVDFHEQECWMGLAAHTSRTQQLEGSTAGLHITPDHVRAAVRRCCREKSAGPNGLQYGHVLAGGEDIIPGLARMFQRHAANPTYQGGGPWQQIVVQLIPKGTKRTLPSTRPIALLDVLQRVYLRSLLEVMRFEDITTRAVWQYGGFAGYQVADMVFALQIALLRASEWGIGIVVVKLDIRDAFSCVSYDALMQALLHANIPAPYVAALLQEIYGCNATIRMGSVQTEESIPLRRGLRQGAPESTLVFNCFLRYALDDLWDSWQRQGTGFGLEKGAMELGLPTAFPHCEGRELVPLMAWIDDLTILANSIHEARSMLTQLLHRLRTHGLHVKADKAQFIAGRAAGGNTIVVHDSVIGVSESMEVLGITLRGDGTAHSHAEASICRATAAYRSHKTTLFSRHLSLKSKLQHWRVTVGSAALWGWEVFPILQRALNRLDSMQLRHIAWIAGFRIHGEGALAERWPQALRHARHLMQLHRIPTLSAQILHRYHSWAGHARRGNNLGHRLLQWRDERWRVAHHQQGSISSRQLRPRAGRPTLWDRELIDTLGRDWCELASDRDAWKSSEPEWVRRVAERRRLSFASMQGMSV